MSFRTQSYNLIILTSVEVALFGRSTQIDRKKLLANIKPYTIHYIQYASRKPNIWSRCLQNLSNSR